MLIFLNLVELLNQNVVNGDAKHISLNLIIETYNNDLNKLIVKIMIFRNFIIFNIINEDFIGVFLYKLKNNFYN